MEEDANRQSLELIGIYSSVSWKMVPPAPEK